MTGRGEETAVDRELLERQMSELPICGQCAYPDGPCRHPDRMFPCVESQGIMILDIAERFGIPFQAGGNIVTWFSLILYR